MDQFVSWLIDGIPLGCIYALVAIGLVLTFKTSGVFNLAFSGQAFLAGWVMYNQVENHGWPLWLGFVVAVLVVSPLVGLLFDRALFRWMRTASWQVKLVSALGLLVAVPEIVKALYSQQPGDNPPSIAPLIGFGDNAWPDFHGTHSFYVLDLGGGHVISADLLATMIVTILAVILLGILFRYTATGLQMRAVVESPRMVELAGVDSDRISSLAWMLSSMFAGLAGVLLAPLYFSVNGTNYQIIIVAAIATAAVGRFQSIPFTFVGALLIGILARAAPDIVGTTSSFAADFKGSAPFILLFLLLVFWPKLREARTATDPLAGVDPPPPAMAHQYKDEALQKASKYGFPVFMVGFLVVMMTLVSDTWVDRITFAFVLAVIFLSITIFTGLGGQISLAQATFATVGGFTLANLASDHGVPVLWGLLIGTVFAAASGALFALLIDGLPDLIGRVIRRPFPRLVGLYLAIATLAAGLIVDAVAGRHPEVIGGEQGIAISRPGWLVDDAHVFGMTISGGRIWFLFAFAVFALVALMVILIRKGTTGRKLAALRGSDTAAASIGVNATAMRITLFSLSAGVAGLGGGLLTLHLQNATPSETLTILGVVWVVLVVTLGSRTVDGAVNAALGFVVFEWLLGAEALGFVGNFAIVGFGLGAITYARHPEGIVEFQTRKSIVNTIRQRALNQRAAAMNAEGRLPREFRPSWQVWLPVFAGPALYLVYILVRTAIQGHWVAVHSGTLLAFIVPSLLYGLWWMFRTDFLLRRDGGLPRGLYLLLAGGALGGLTGWIFNDNGWPLHHDLASDVLVGIPAGIAVVGFVLIPMHIRQIARARRWLSMPLPFTAGIAPASFVIMGAFLFFRTTANGEATGSIITAGSPPSGWPVAFVTTLFVIAWVQWFGGTQGAFNELAIGGENFQPPEEKAYVAERAIPVPAPAGGAE